MDPVFTNIPARRSANDNNGKVIQDLEERMPTRHPYRHSDRVTWAHETTHGLQANIRNANVGPGRPKNAFYCLEGRAILCLEPNFRMRDYANLVPQAVRGQIYKQYMVDQRRWWDDRPLYAWDEWVAYTNGTATRLELEMDENWSEIQFMLEMLVYSAHVLIHIGDSDTSDENVQRERAFAWMADRSFRFFETPQSGIAGARDYWALVNFNAPKVIELLERLKVLYPKVMGGVPAEGEITLPLTTPVHVCSQPRRDELRASPHL
jgi:hypothetical protein